MYRNFVIYDTAILAKFFLLLDYLLRPLFQTVFFQPESIRSEIQTNSRPNCFGNRTNRLSVHEYEPYDY